MKLLGQHLVMKTVPNAIYNHINDNDNDGNDNKPKKPLVMSFHGLTGVGKTYLSQLIAKYIYYKGGKSAFVHTLIASKHFPDDDPTKIKEYKNKLRDLVESETKKCGRSLFIFDETDKMPAGLTDVLKPFLDFHVHGIDGVDYSKNIFIFLNNIGGGEISDVALAQNRSGLPRESISSFKMEQILSVASLKKEHSWLKKNPKTVSLVDHFIPFLPLEKHHVKQCVGIEIMRRVKGNKSDSKYKELVENVVNEIEFFPTGEDIFAVSGCKHVAKKVDMFWNNYGGEL